MRFFRGSRQFSRRALMAPLVMSFLASALSNSTALYAGIENRQRADDLLPVDCLLPGAVRKLGGKHTYLTARRPVKTTAVNCEIRGGEYVHYDRADYQTALTIWLPMAEQGDARAQNYVGEIYEKGLGTAPDYALAAQWYARAVEQEYAPAQVNLGHLHELGRGVDHSMDTAIDLYRQAAGIKGKQLKFVSWDYSDEKYAQLSHQVNSQAATLSRQQREIEKLTYQLDASQEREETLAAQIDIARGGYREELQALELAKATVAQQQARLARLEQSAAAPRPEPGPSAAEYRELEAQKAELVTQSAALATQRSEIEQQQSRLRQQARDLAQQAKALNGHAQRTEQTDAELAAARKAIDDQAHSLEARTAALETQQQALTAREQRIDNKLALASSLSESVDTQRRELEKAEAEVAQRESDLAQRESALFQKSSELRKLNEELASLRRQLTENANAFAGSSSEESGETADTKPVIEMIEPQLLATRGDQYVVKTRAGLDQRTIIGRVLSGNPIRELLINERKARLDERGIFQQRIPILGKETPVSIVAVDRAGLRSNLDFVLGIEVPETNLYENDTESATPKPPRRKVPRLNYGNYHALLIGNKDYQTLPSLDTTMTDATAFRDVLRDRYSFNTTLLTNATRYDILSALEKLRQELTDEDNLLIYYAGHGELDEVNTRGHWLPVDAEENSRANWISNVAISDILNSMSANKVLVVADSCYSGTMTRSTLARLDAGRSDKAWESWLKKQSNSHSRLIFSSGGVAPVLDGGGGQHSIFAKALLDVLRSNDGVLEGRQVHAQVAQAVNYAAQAAQFDQTPLYAPIKFAGHEGGDFLFVAQEP